MIDPEYLFLKPLFLARWGLFFTSLYVCKSPAILLDLGEPNAWLCQCCFRQHKSKLLSLSLCAAGTQLMVETFHIVFRRYIILTSAHLRCWQAELHRLAQVGGTSVTGSNPVHWPMLGKTNLKLCREAACKICSANVQLVICKLPCLKYVIIRNNRNNTQ